MPLKADDHTGVTTDQTQTNDVLTRTLNQPIESQNNPPDQAQKKITTMIDKIDFELDNSNSNLNGFMDQSTDQSTNLRLNGKQDNNGENSSLSDNGTSKTNHETSTSAPNNNIVDPASDDESLGQFPPTKRVKFGNEPSFAHRLTSLLASTSSSTTGSTNSVDNYADRIHTTNANTMPVIVRQDRPNHGNNVPTKSISGPSVTDSECQDIDMFESENMSMTSVAANQTSNPSGTFLVQPSTSYHIEDFTSVARSVTEQIVAQVSDQQDDRQMDL